VLYRKARELRVLQFVKSAISNMKKSSSNRIYSGTAKQKAPMNKRYYITAIIGKGTGTLSTVVFNGEHLADLVLYDNTHASFPWPIATEDFHVSVNGANISIVYYEEQIAQT
jgi:hypothetical protein